MMHAQGWEISCGCWRSFICYFHLSRDKVVEPSPKLPLEPNSHPIGAKAQCGHAWRTLAHTGQGKFLQ